MRHVSIIGLIAAGSAIALSACTMPRHQDAILFGTDTKVAFDVGVQPENSNTPSITLGYKRREFVLMPLVEYGPADQYGLIPAILTGDGSLVDVAIKNNEQNASENTGDQYVGTKYCDDDGACANAEKDTYSVFATFGGNFSGSAGQGDNEAAARIKQVFATGHAARIAAEQGADFVNPAAPVANERAEETRLRQLRSLENIQNVNNVDAERRATINSINNLATAITKAQGAHAAFQDNDAQTESMALTDSTRFSNLAEAQKYLRVYFTYGLNSEENADKAAYIERWRTYLQ